MAEVVDDDRVTVGKRRARLEDVRRARVGDDVLDLALGEAGVHRHRDGAEHLDAAERERPVVPVGEADGDSIAPVDAERAQATGDSGRSDPRAAGSSTARRRARRAPRVGPGLDRRRAAWPRATEPAWCSAAPRRASRSMSSIGYGRMRGVRPALMIIEPPLRVLSARPRPLDTTLRDRRKSRFAHS